LIERIGKATSIVPKQKTQKRKNKPLMTFINQQGLHPYSAKMGGQDGLKSRLGGPF
jgi:hypothetical protein